MTGADQVMRLAFDFDEAAAEIPLAVFETYKQAGDEFAKDWSQSAARDVSPHAKRYPSSITSESKVSTDIVIQTGPLDTASGQGFLGRVLEFGGEHSPAYLHGLKAMEQREPLLMRATDATIAHLLP